MNDLMKSLLLGCCLGLGASPVFAACPEGALGNSRTIEVGGEALPLGLQSYPRTLDLADHEIVLTFDDGPAAPTGKVLDALKAECVKATFFLIGQNADASPAMVKRTAGEGHSIGHHSYSHPGKTLRGMSFEAAKADIEKGIAADQKASGDSSPPAFFRFPGYADTPELLAYLKERGITVFGSDVWASDWNNQTPKQELDLILSRLEEAGKGIVLFHDSKAQTAAMLPDFLKELKKRGFKVAHVVAGAGPTPLVDAPKGWKSTTEPIVQKVLGKGAGKKAEKSDDEGR